MKIYNIALLALIGITGIMIHVMGKRASSDEATALPAASQAVSPDKAADQKTGPVSQNLLKTKPVPVIVDHSATIQKAGTLRRLSLVPPVMDKAPAKIQHKDTPQPEAPRTVTSQTKPKTGELLPLKSAQPIRLNTLTIDPADIAPAANIDTGLTYTKSKDELFHKVVTLAEASPVQPDNRGCGAKVLETSKSAENKVNSVGYQRKITPRIGVGVEYVYQDGCYQNAIAPIRSQNLPADDGVNIRLNMQF